MTTVVVFGGGGFLGRRLVHRLTTEGMTVRVAVRHPDPARIELRSMGFDRVTVVPADVRDQASVAAAVAGANAVVNTVSAYVEKGGVTFEAVHVQGAETVAREAVAAGVARLVLVSGIGADADSGSPYIRARGRGEQVVQQTFPEATIVRPGAMFGPGDALFGTLAELARLLPVLPLIGGGQYPTAASLCGRRGGGYRQHTHRPPNRRPNLRACRSRSVHAARAGQDDATPHEETATAHTGALCGGRDPGAAVRAPAKPTAHHRPS